MHTLMRSPRIKANAALVRFCKANFSVERSRSQVLCRTGYRGAGQSTTFKFGPGQAFASEAAAVARAKEWLSSLGERD